MQLLLYLVGKLFAEFYTKLIKAVDTPDKSPNSRALSSLAVVSTVK
jgi:hypothetical protein